MDKTIPDCDTVILGLGGVGYFALRAVAKGLQEQGKAGSRVLGLERCRRCHGHGSSHGHSRVYRMAYFEHPSYVPWVQFSVREFRNCNKDSTPRCSTSEVCW
jgi:sarcosine oxidase